MPKIKSKAKTRIVEGKKESFFFFLNTFWQKLGFPFIIIILGGVVIYLVSVISRYQAEQKNIQSLLATSNPKEEFTLKVPEARDIRKWSTFHFENDLSVSFRYPINWRTEPSGTASLIREGEAAVLSAEAIEEPTDESTLLTYRVARLSALSESGYQMTNVFDTYIDGIPAIVISYIDREHKSVFYEAVIPHYDRLYRILLVIKQAQLKGTSEAIVNEYKTMLGTLAFPS